MALRKILCATDFSPTASLALAAATTLAKQHDAALVIVNAWQLPAYFSGDMGFPGDVVQAMSDDAMKSLAEAVVTARGAGVKEVASSLLSGPAWQAIVESIQADATIDLVVVGTHGRGGVSRILLGSVATQVVRHAPCSVLAVHANDAPPPYRNVLLPVDFSESTPHALEAALSIAGSSLARLLLLHVIDAALEHHGEITKRVVHLLDEEATAKLETLASTARCEAGVEVTGRIRLGSRSRVILEELEKVPPFDVVVVGSHGRTGLRRALLGSVAEAVVHHAPCTVLVVRTR